MSLTTDQLDHDEPVTRADIEHALATMNRHAKRQPHVIAKLEGDKPTAWDKAHRCMDGPLDEWLAAQH